jgi:hypothetical protein
MIIELNFIPPKKHISFRLKFDPIMSQNIKEQLNKPQKVKQISIVFIVISYYKKTFIISK